VLLLLGWWMASLMLKAVHMSRTVVLILSIATVVLGVYSLNGRVFDLVVMFVAGVIGYFMLRYGYSTAAAALAFVLGGELERSFRLGLNLVDGSFVAFFTRPITATILIVTLFIVFIGVVRSWKFRKREMSRAKHGMTLGDQS